jgi:hypothetical protein
MGKSKRITIRLDNAAHDLIQARCQALQVDISTIIRMAVEAFIGSKNEEQGPGGRKTGAGFALPGEAHACTPGYMGWSGGDLRNELRRVFMRTLGCAWVARQHYPRTESVVELCMGLLQFTLIFIEFGWIPRPRRLSGNGKWSCGGVGHLAGLSLTPTSDCYRNIATRTRTRTRCGFKLLKFLFHAPLAAPLGN